MRLWTRAPRIRIGAFIADKIKSRAGALSTGGPPALGKKAAEIDASLIATQGTTVDMGGYYHPDKKKLGAALRPCPTLNAIIDAL